MVQLPNGCSCSKMGVTPQNWEKPGASVEIYWPIPYRFYNPTYKKDRN